MLGVYSLLLALRFSGVALTAGLCSLLQVVGVISSRYSFTGLERVRGLLSPLLPSPSALFFVVFFFFSTLRMAVQAFCLSDGEELLSILYSQE